MTALVTGSSGHLGEALVRTLRDRGMPVRGIDIKPGPFTTLVGSITDQALLADGMAGVDTVYHVATLHKPHVVTHSREAFIDVNILGTQRLLETAKAAGVSAFVFTSTTSVFSLAASAPGAAATWVTEELLPRPKNIYGATKLGAEALCRIAHHVDGLPCIVLRTSRFFPEDDDDPKARGRFTQDNLQLNEFLYRRVDIEDVVSAHLLAAEHASDIGHGTFIISAPPPFARDEAERLGSDAAGLLEERPDISSVYGRLGWALPERLDRVYDSRLAQERLGWQPRHPFRAVLDRVAGGGRPLSDLAYAVGAKGYHDETFTDGPYPVG